MGIRVLDDSTINKIAAGEVVENPSAVVKELTENSIDAGATSVTVEIEGGGIGKIRVTDNGCGIESGEVELSFTRHATSKIFDYRDLDAVGTLGFRGEALASIAAVSLVEMSTKTRNADMGVVVNLEGGKLLQTQPAGLPNGTTIIVRNLFFNTPVRRKFLKSTAQETAAVTEVVSKLILSHPEVSIRYISNGETVFHSPGSAKMKDALISVYGRELMDKLANVEYTYNHIHIYGYIGLPQFALKHRRSQSYIVNGRMIKGQMISLYVQKAYSQRILKGHFPFALLYLDMAYQFTDVNVHPNKLNIRFKDDNELEYAVCEAVNDALMHKNIAGILRLEEPEAGVNNPVSFEEPEEIPQETEHLVEEQTESIQKQVPPDTEHRLHTDEIPEPQEKTVPPRPVKPAETQNRNVYKQTDFFKPAAPVKNTVLRADSGMFFDVMQSLNEKETLKKEKEVAEKPPETPVLSMDTPYKVLGQLFDSYILIECADKLLLLDQHAAHERLIYDKAVESFHNKSIASAPLLTPEIAAFSHEEKLLVDENIGLFREIGFDLEEFGPLEYRVTAVPYIFRETRIAGLIDDMLGELKAGVREKPLLRAENMLKAACKKAIKANMRLSEAETGMIIREYLEKAVMPTCPHGRPILTVITRAEIEKGFKRRV